MEICTLFTEFNSTSELTIEYTTTSSFTSNPCCKNPSLFMKVQRGLFSSRRKNIRNNLTNFLSNGDLAEQALTKAGLDPKLRAETLPVSSILLLTDILDDIM